MLESGKIIEDGTYESLLQAEGTFTRLLNIQKKVESESEVSVKSLEAVGKVLDELPV